MSRGSSGGGEERQIEAVRLLERERELGALAALLDAPHRGEGRLIAIRGHAGMGKSSLLAAARADAEAIQVLEARGSDLERGLAFGLALQLFERPLRDCSKEERAALLDGPARLAAPLLAPTAQPVESVPGGDPSLPIIHGLFWLALNLGADRPLVLVADDLHWSDAASLRMLAYLAARLDELGIGILLAWRPGEPGAPGELLDRIGASAGAKVIDLEPLSRSAVRELIGASLPAEPEPGFFEACHEATGGNPLYVRELVGEIARRGTGPTVGRDQLAGLRLEGLARSIALRLSSLSKEARALVRAVAVLDPDPRLATARRVAGLDPEPARRAARELADVDLVAGVDPLGFRHPIAREAIYGDLPHAHRLSLHAAAAAALADDGAAAERVAAQLARCDPIGDEWALDALREAASEATAHGAPEAAIPHLRRALEETTDRDRRAELLVELGRVEVAAGSPSAAETMRDALGLVRDPRSRMTAWLELGRSLGLQMRVEEAVRAFENGIDELGPGDVRLARPLEADVITWALTFAPLEAEARSRIDAISADPPEPREPGDRLVVASLALDAALTADRVETAAERAEAAIGDGRLLAEAGAGTPPYHAACTALAVAGRLERADELLAAAKADGRERPALRGFVASLVWRSWVLWGRGLLAEAEDEARDALEQPRGTVEVIRPVALAALAQALIERADAAGAAQALAEAPLEAMAGLVTVVEPALEARGRLALERDDPEDALVQFDLLRTSEERRSGRPLRLTFWQPWCAQALMRLGRAEEARGVAVAAERAVGATGSDRALAAAHRARAVAESGDARIEALRAALEALAPSESRLERARALVELGTAVRQAGRTSEARELLSRGLDQSTRCGATVLADRARRELIDAGARPRRAALAGVEALTPRELTICRAAARGLTNREIAASLFVSPKTVQSHLRTAYRKLGIRGRGELGAALSRRRPGAG